MIRFFRSLRQRLLTENKISKYLLYAIGEILLVVIGILIALQINNWNEERIRQDAVKRHLKSLAGAVQHDIREMGISMGFNEFRFHSWQYSLRHSDIGNDSLKDIPRPDPYIVSRWDKPYPEQVDQEFIETSLNEVNDAFLGMFFNYSAIREINNQGIFSDMDNESLKDKINEYYYNLDWKFGEQSVDYRHKRAEDLKTYLREEHAISCTYPPNAGRLFEIIRKDEKAAILFKELILMAHSHYWVTQDLQQMGMSLVQLIHEELNLK
ncbi:hypothetical protein [Robiginitalea sp. IMCC43444]|uniref:hypothetical protein n=1 Tax=Robiginitalea sp. IMCC43444 TaxID=3459121 RepID=UPI0040411A2D